MNSNDPRDEVERRTDGHAPRSSVCRASPEGGHSATPDPGASAAASGRVLPAAAATRTRSNPLWSPYVAGAGLGLTLALSYVVLGTGLGASGAVARTAAASTHVVAPQALETNPYTAPWFEGGSPLAYYLVFMAIGVVGGGFLSALAARRVGIAVERGPRISAKGRLAFAVAGGLLAGFSSRMAGGCTSGLALSGMATWVPGGWAFLIAMFATGFLVAPLARKEWTP